MPKKGHNFLMLGFSKSNYKTKLNFERLHGQKNFFNYKKLTIRNRNFNRHNTNKKEAARCFEPAS